MVRSVLAVLAGLAAMTVVVIAFTMLAGALLYPDRPVTSPVDPSGTWLVVNLAYSTLAAILGGWVAARLARRARFGHAVALALVVVVMSIAGGAASTGQPGWYSLAIAV
ncbi:MAG: hypothetical protein R3326_06035, partial [Gemmatimonadota bacterium]|nr:hypothetical protein [Gemmatimonadota bacterium]